ncbi:hypothetical protein JHW43_009309 [Diplocarpon mali]|nr:hypothetical protein JHW43_009309 [Diplocarpon mali]
MLNIQKYKSPPPTLLAIALGVPAFTPDRASSPPRPSQGSVRSGGGMPSLSAGGTCIVNIHDPHARPSGGDGTTTTAKKIESRSRRTRRGRSKEGVWCAAQVVPRAPSEGGSAVSFFRSAASAASLPPTGARAGTSPTLDHLDHLDHLDQLDQLDHRALHSTIGPSTPPRRRAVRETIDAESAVRRDDARSDQASRPKRPGRASSTRDPRRQPDTRAKSQSAPRNSISRSPAGRCPAGGGAQKGGRGKKTNTMEEEKPHRRGACRTSPVRA